MPRAKRIKHEGGYEGFEDAFHEETLYTPTEYIQRQLEQEYTKEQVAEWYNILCDLIRTHYSGQIYNFEEVFKKYQDEEAERRRKEEEAARPVPKPIPCRSVFSMYIRT